MDTFYSHLILVNFPGIFWAGNIPKSKMKKRKNWDLTLVIQSETSNRLNKSHYFLACHSVTETDSEWKGTSRATEISSLISTTLPNTVKYNCLVQLI